MILCCIFNFMSINPMSFISKICKQIFGSNVDNEAVKLEDDDVKIETKDQRSYAEICDSIIKLEDGSYGFAAFNPYVDNENDIIPYLDSDGVVYFRFNDGRGGVSATSYIDLAVISDVETKKTLALLPVNGHYLTLELSSGDRVVNKKGEVFYEMPSPKPSIKSIMLQARP